MNKRGDAWHKHNEAWLLWQRITAIFAICGTLVGLMLRGYFVYPFRIHFHYWLHAHSHVMLLGWIYNALLLLIYRRFFHFLSRFTLLLIGCLQVGVLGMLVFFPIQGYGPVAIVFSSMHLLSADILAIYLYRNAATLSLPIRRAIRLSSLFQLIASLGPFALAYIMTHGGASTPLYQISIYFYLHFLYNGVFFYLMLALWIPENYVNAKEERLYGGMLYAMGAGTVFTFAHVILAQRATIYWSILAASGSMLQLLVWVIWLYLWSNQLRKRAGNILIWVFTTKFVLQMIGSFSPLREIVATQRFWLMAYLHFIFLGIFTPFLIRLLQPRIWKSVVPAYWTFWMLTEICLLLPYLLIDIGISQHVWYSCIFAFYMGLATLLLMGFGQMLFTRQIALE